MLPAAGSGDGGAHGALGSCWEPQDSHTGTAGSHHLQAQPQPRMWGRVQSEGGSSQEPGRARWVPSAAFREVFLQKLKLHRKNTSLLQSGLLFGAVSQLRQHPAGRSRTLGTSAPVPGPPCPTRHLEGTRGRRCSSSSLTQFVPGRGIQASSACRLRAPGSPGEPAQQTLNVTTITRRLPQPQRRHPSCSTSPAPAQPGKEGRDSAWIPALAHALVSSEPQIPRALFNPASAGLHGLGEGFCRAAIAISGPALSCFPWTQGVF